MMRTLILLFALLVVAGCTSPEAGRVRAGGPGGDPGNRKPDVELHEGAKPYYETPRLLAEHPTADRGARR